MSKPISRLKSYSPVIKKSSFRELQALLNQISEQHNEDVKALIARSEEWATEVRALRLEIQRIREYDKWLAMNYPNANVIAGQRMASHEFGYKPLISIIMPVYNTDPSYLKTCVDSVLAQSYTNWELCIVDDASNNQDTLNCLKAYENDKRIRIKRSAENGHISVASNQGIEIAKGEFIALLDHDDFLWPNALFEVVSFLQSHKDADFVYSDEDKIEADGYMHFDPYFKPNWSPHLLECINYITHFSVMRTALVRKVGGFDKNMVGAQDWDLFLRMSENTQKIYHVPTILYSWRAHERSTAKSGGIKDYAIRSQEHALEQHFVRTEQAVRELKPNPETGMWHPKFEIKGRPLISIVIPTKDKVDYLERCVNSILDKSTYLNYEVVIVDTGSVEEATKVYYKKLKETLSPKKLRIVKWKQKPFNYSDACNFGAKNAKGTYLVMLNNDTEVIGDDWLQDMLGYAQQPAVAAVGAKLLYPNMQVQHAGVTVGIGSFEPVAGHIGINSDYKSNDFLTKIYTESVRDTTAVTAACLMVSTEKFWKVNGFDPTFRVTFNDVDLCLKFRKAGFNNIYLPYVELFHHESVSIGRVNNQNRDMTELETSAKLMRKRWAKTIDNDPYYNKNFYILSSNFGLAIHSNLK